MIYVIYTKTEHLKSVFGVTHMLKRTLCCGQTPRFWRIVFRSGADVFALDVSGARGGWKQASEDRPKKAEMLSLSY